MKSIKQGKKENKWNISFFIGVILGFWMGYACAIDSHNANYEQKSSLEEGPVGVSFQSVEDEKQQLDLFISRLGRLEDVASDWFRDHGPTIDRRIEFLTKKGQQEIPLSVEGVLNCVVDNPQEEYPHCNSEYFHFYEYGCDYQGCAYTFCRAGETPYSCIYSGHGYLNADSLRWEHSAGILDERVLPLGKWLYETRRWEVSELL